MKILSIMALDPNEVAPPSPEEMEKMGRLIAEMRGKGVLLDTGGRPGDMLELKVTRKGAQSTVIDGPFAEAKEVIGGYAVLDVKDRADAIAWTNRFLEIIGNATCYVREVFSPPM